MTDLTEIVYLDCNRQNSVKSEFNTNEWEYKIGDEGLVLPQGTQISIQNSLINKKGLTGSSIVIDEDIDETMSISYYKSDNENFAPVGAKVSNPNEEAIFESLYDDYTALADGGSKFKRDIGDTTIPEIYRGHGDTIVVEERGNQNSQDIGKSEAPLQAIHLTVGKNYSPLQGDRWLDHFIEPLTHEIGIFIPKGVYGVSQMAALIEGQIDGTLIYERVKKHRDFNTDFTERKLQKFTVNTSKTTNFDNRTTYRLREPVDFNEGRNSNIDWTDPYNVIYQGYNSFVSCFGNNQPTSPNFVFLATKSAQFGASGAGTNADPRFLTPTSLQQQGVLYIPQTQERIYYDGWNLVNGETEGGGGIEIGGVIRLENVIRGYEGSPFIEDDPDNGILSIPFGTYLEVDRTAIENPKAAENTDFDPPLEIFPNGETRSAGLFTIPKYVNDMRKVYLTPPPTAEVDGLPTAQEIYRSRRRYLYALNTIGVQYNPPIAPMPLTPARPNNQGIPQLNHGDLFHKLYDPVPIEGLKTQPRPALINNTEYDYNPLRNGYYIGTPDFRLNWSPETSSFAINNLHHAWRCPAYDNYGNAIETAGEEGVMLKRANENSKNATFTDNTANPNYINQAFARSFQNTVSRYGGISVFNWARTVARKMADVDYRNGRGYNQDKLHLLTFNDYFSTTSKAKQAWNSTIWARLGFTYDQMCNEDAYELNQYYDRDIQGEKTLPSFTTKDDTTQNNIFPLTEENPHLFGTTTRANLGVAAASGVSTAYNPTEILYEGSTTHIAPRTYNNMDINTPFNVAGRAIPYKSSAGNTTDFGGDVNNIYSYFGSMWREMTGTIILTKGRPLQALSLPTLNEQGYYIITSDILEAHEDSIKNTKGMGLLGVVPFSQQATNDFMNNTEPLIHILNQKKIINSIKFKVLYPNLKNPEIDPNSSVILKIVRPVQAQRKTDPNEQNNPNHKKKA